MTGLQGSPERRLEVWGGKKKEEEAGCTMAQVQSWLRQNYSFAYHFAVYLDFNSKFSKISLTEKTFIVEYLLFYRHSPRLWEANKEIKNMI